MIRSGTRQHVYWHGSRTRLVSRSIMHFASPAWVLPLVSLAYVGYFKGAPIFEHVPIDPTAGLAVACTCAFAHLAMGRSWRGRRVVAAVLGLWLVFGVAGVISLSSHRSLTKVSELFSLTLLCALLPCFVLGGQRARRWLLGMTLACSIVMALAALVAPDPVAGGTFGRFSLDGSTTIGTARVIGAGVVVSALLALIATRARFFWCFLAIAGTAVTASVGSRGPLLSMLISVFVTVLLSRALGSRRLLKVAQVIAVGGVLIALAVASPSAATDRVRLFVLGDESDSGRQYLFSTAWHDAIEKPFGVGWGGFQVNHAFGGIYPGQSIYPHNIVLEIAVEGGWLAVAVFLVFVAFSLRGLVRQSFTAEASALLGLGLYWLLVAQTSSDVNGNRMTWVMLALGLIFELDPEDDSGMRFSSRDRGVPDTPVGHLAIARSVRWF